MAGDRTELSQLQIEAKALIAAMDITQAKIDEEVAEDNEDDTKLRVYRKEFAKQKLEFEGVRAKVEGIKATIRDKEKIERDLLVHEIGDMSGKKTHESEAYGPAEIQSMTRDQEVRMKAVSEYLQGGSFGGKDFRDMPAKLQEKMRPKCSKFMEGSRGMVLPKPAVDLIMGRGYSDRWLAKTSLMDMISGKASCSGTGDYSTKPWASQNTSMTAAAIWTEYKRNLLHLPGEPTEVLDRVTVVPAQSGTAQWVRTTSTDAAEYASVVAYWLTCEGDNKTETQAKFETFDIDCFELQAYTQITDRALGRSLVPIESILATMFRKAVLHALETAVLVGSGAGEPDGIVDVAGIHQVARVCNTQVKCSDTIELEFALRRQHRKNAMYVLQDDALKELKLDRFSGTDCDCVVHCLDNNQINGYPHLSTHRLPALGTAGDVLFGDFSEYIMAIEQEIVLARSSDEYDSFRRNATGFKIYMIVGGEVSQPRAFAQLDDCTGDACSCTS